MSLGSVLDFIPAGLHAAIRAYTSTTDVATYVQSALNAGVGYFPAGRYVLGATLTVAAAERLMIVGDGSSATDLVWTSTVDGLSLTYSDPRYPPSVMNLALRTSSVNVGVALTIAGGYLSSFTQLGPVVDGVKFVSSLENENSGGWLKGLSLSRVWYPRVSNCAFKGWYDGSYIYGMARAIELDRVQAPNLLNNTIFHAITAIEQIGNETPNPYGEGVSIAGGEIVGVRNGIILNHSSITAGTSIRDLHINASYRAIVSTNHVQIHMHDLLIYKTAPSSENFIGISLDFADDANVHDIIFGGDPSPSTYVDYGVLIANSKNASIANIKSNYFGNVNHGVLVGGGNTGVYIERVRAGSYPGVPYTPVVVNAGTTGTQIRESWPLAAQNLPTNVAVPNVDNALREEWTTTNSATTVYTNFVGGIEDQVLEILSTDNFTSVQHNVDVNLKGGLSWSMAAGAILTLKKRDGVWRETSRRPA
ncbi:MAG: hypothetical protein J7515_18190 [Caulobacter sp.]|nr:hypothetical protein [Caulobacter sp.]